MGTEQFPACGKVVYNGRSSNVTVKIIHTCHSNFVTLIETLKYGNEPPYNKLLYSKFVSNVKCII